MNLRGRNCASAGAINAIMNMVPKSSTNRNVFISCILDAATVDRDCEKEKYTSKVSLFLSQRPPACFFWWTTMETGNRRGDKYKKEKKRVYTCGLSAWMRVYEFVSMCCYVGGRQFNWQSWRKKELVSPFYIFEIR